MSHEIQELDKVGYSYQPAWHGLGKVFDRVMKTADVLRDTSLGSYRVIQTPGLLAYDPKSGKPWLPTEKTTAPPPGFKLVRTDALFNCRDDVAFPDRRAMLTQIGVRDAYEIVQNEELCEIADRVFGEAGARYESAGTLRNGQLVWLLARHPEDGDVQGDKIRDYILIFSSHDATRPITVMDTPVRVVCYNTLSEALSNKAKRITIRHTASVRDRIETAVQAARAARSSFQDAVTLYNSMARKAVTERFVDAYLKAIYPDPKGEGRQTGKAVSKRERVKDLIYNRQARATGPGMRLKGNVTQWAVYNGISEYWQYLSTSRTAEGRDENEERFFQNVDGTQLRQRTAALDTLLRGDELLEVAGSRN